MSLHVDDVDVLIQPETGVGRDGRSLDGHSVQLVEESIRKGRLPPHLDCRQPSANAVRKGRWNGEKVCCWPASRAEMSENRRECACGSRTLGESTHTERRGQQGQQGKERIHGDDACEPGRLVGTRLDRVSVA